MVKVQSSATMVECQVDANQELKNKQTKIYTFLCGFNFFSLALLFALHFSMLVSNAIFFETLPQTVYLLIIMGHLLGCAILIVPLIWLRNAYKTVKHACVGDFEIICRGN